MTNLPPAQESVHTRLTDGFTVTITGPAGPTVAVSDAEVAERTSEYTFVLTTDPPVLETAQEWWNGETRKRRLRDGCHMQSIKGSQSYRLAIEQQVFESGDVVIDDRFTRRHGHSHLQMRLHV